MSESEWKTGNPPHAGEWLGRWSDGTQGIVRFGGNWLTLRDFEPPTWWAPIEYPLPPELPPLQRVCEGLGVSTIDYGHLLEPDALLWRIEGAMAKKLARLRPVYMGGEDGAEWMYQAKRESAIYGVSRYGASRGEALLEAAKWLMEQEGDDE